MSTVYSERLGAITEAQFEAVAARLGLGRFVAAMPIATGLFGQNVFLTTTQGEFVLRGAPHWVKGPAETEYRREDRWQFTKERFFAQQLHEKTKAPVPWPMLHDEASDIFGWPYLVMPRMPGLCTDERSILKILDADDRRGVAQALGAMLAEMQRLTWPFAGDYGVDTIALEPYAGGATRRVVDETRTMLAMAQTNGTITDDDRSWIEEAAALALSAPEAAENTFVHGDYKLNNLTLLEDGGAWRVSGLFDLHEARFGDGALDLVRQACAYLDTEPALARVFVESCGRAKGAEARMPLYVLNDRMKFWEYFTRPDVKANWLAGKTFKDWAGRYMDGVMALL